MSSPAAHSSSKIVVRDVTPIYIKTAQEIVDLNVTEIPMLLSPLLPRKGLAFFCGSSDTGKSYFLLYLALCICGQDDDIFGYKVNRGHGSVIMVCTEEAMEDICVRLTGLTKGRVINMKKLRFIFETDKLDDKLKSELEREPADLIIIDTFGDLFSGTLNDSISVRQYLKIYKELAIRFQTLFLFNHHIGKGKEKNGSPSKNDVLGSQGIESASRVVFDLRKVDQGRRILTVVKGNHIPDEIKNQGIVLGFEPERGFWKIEGNEIQPLTKETEELIKAKEELVLQYSDKYNTVRQIAEELTKDGHPISKTKVAEILKKHRPSVPNPSE